MRSCNCQLRQAPLARWIPHSFILSFLLMVLQRSNNPERMLWFTHADNCPCNQGELLWCLIPEVTPSHLSHPSKNQLYYSSSRIWTAATWSSPDRGGQRAVSVVCSILGLGLGQCSSSDARAEPALWQRQISLVALHESIPFVRQILCVWLWSCLNGGAVIL